MTTLEIKDLHVSVTAPDGADVPILKSVNLTVKSGERFTLAPAQVSDDLGAQIIGDAG